MVFLLHGIFVEEIKSQFDKLSPPSKWKSSQEILGLRTVLGGVWWLSACQGYLSTFLFCFAKLNVGQYYYLGLKLLR